MPKRGLDVSSCEVFRFYKLVTIKSLIEPLSMIVPRRVSVAQKWQTPLHKEKQTSKLNTFHRPNVEYFSESAVHVSPVGVVPRGPLSNDGWKQACSDCRGVARWHGQRLEVKKDCAWDLFVSSSLWNCIYLLPLIFRCFTCMWVNEISFQ